MHICCVYVICSQRSRWCSLWLEKRGNRSTRRSIRGIHARINLHNKGVARFHTRTHMPTFAKIWIEPWQRHSIRLKNLVGVTYSRIPDPIDQSTAWVRCLTYGKVICRRYQCKWLAGVAVVCIGARSKLCSQLAVAILCSGGSTWTWIFLNSNSSLTDYWSLP